MGRFAKGWCCLLLWIVAAAPWAVQAKAVSPVPIMHTFETAVGQGALGNVSFWDQYRYHALGIAAVVLVQSVLLTLLLVQLRRRARTESLLQHSEKSMKLATEAADLATWIWDIETDTIDSFSPKGHFLDERVQSGGLKAMLAAVHEDDRSSLERAVQRALEGDGLYESEYRITDFDGVVRWYAGRGRVEHLDGKPRRMLGVTLDITTRKTAELEVQHQRNELAHLSRVAMVGELSGSMAHELNQPLMAILSNAQAARMFLRHEPVDLVELAAILDDIVENDKRAGEIIWGLRKMLKKEQAEHKLLALNELVREVLRLMRNDLVNRHVAVEASFDPDEPAIRGDRIQLQQVMVNLLLNACDAMASLPYSGRLLRVRVEFEAAEASKVRVSVSDRGSGIVPGREEEVFAPFYTTKPQGLGLGLAVCKSIIAGHRGVLRAENNPEGGATFTFTLPAKATVRA